MPIVLDASVALKLIAPEPGSDQARASVLDEERIAPDWMLAEVASGLANKVKHEGANEERMRLALAALPKFVDRLYPTRPLLPEALELAVRLRHALYDCLYLALAIPENARVVTADRDFSRSATKSGYGRHVELLTW